MGKIQFSPNSGQKEALLKMHPGCRLLMLCGWATGKTTGGGFFGQRLGHLNPGVRGLVASHNYNHCKHNLVPKIVDYLKQAGTFRKHHQTDRIITLKLAGQPEAEIQWGSADKPKSLDGNDVGWGVGDEIRHWPEESYKIFTSRIRDKRAAYPSEILLTTPEMNWIHKEFAENESIILVKASTHVNEHNLRDNYIEDMLSRLSPELARQFIYAEWVGAEGAAFPEFNRDIHCQEDLAETDREGWCWAHPCVDFGGKHAAVYIQHLDYCMKHSTQGCFHVVGEWMPDALPTYRFVRELGERMRQAQIKPLTCYPDKAGYGTNYQTGVRDIELLEQCGFTCEWTTDPASVSIVNGSDLIRSLLSPVHGNPRLYFDASLLDSERGIVSALEQIKIQEGTRKYRKDGNLEHALDAFRYGIVNIEPPISLAAEAY